MNFLEGLVRQSPVLSAIVVFMFLSLGPKFSMMMFDERLHNGVNIWIKPIKFDIALILYVCTLIFFAQWIKPETRSKTWFKTFNSVVVFCIAFEIIWINSAAMAGIGSHFNVATPLMGFAYTLAGIGATTLTSGALVYGVLIARNNETGLSREMHFAIWTSSILMFALTLTTASYMAAQTSHFVGGNMLDVEALPIMGWATDGGDLRVAHFFASHIFHAVPLFVLGAQLLLKSVSIPMVIAATLAYIAFTIYTLWEAMQGLPFLFMILG